MKILIDSYNCVFQNPAGGIQTRIKALSREFDCMGIDFSLYDKWNDKLIDYDIFHYFKVNHEAYDLIFYAKAKGIKIVISSVIPINHSLRFMANKAVASLVRTPLNYSSKILSMSDAIIAQTEIEREYIFKEYKVNPDKIFVIPNGVGINFSEANPEEFKAKHKIKGNYVLQVGTIEKNKNQINVIRALKGTGIPVVFVGGANAGQPQYHQQCLKEADENMIFTGWINNEDNELASIYTGAKVVVLPSIQEIFGNSLIEGGMAGANLVATHVLPIKEWGIENFCRTIDPSNIKDIKEKVINAYNSPLYQESIEVIASKFSWNNVAQQYINLYTNVLKG